ncbi:MAG: GC-type dockerin domain-anchored protein [Phycisphaerales bacterium]
MIRRQDRTAILALIAGAAAAGTANAQYTVERISQRLNGQTVVECNGDSRQPQVSADGNNVVFISASNNLIVSGPLFSSAQVWRHNRSSKGNTFVTLSGFEGPPTNAPRGLNGSCSDPAYRGGPTLFTNNSNNPPDPFDPCPDANDADDIYNSLSVFSKTSTPNPCGTFGNGDSAHAAVSADGSTVAFDTVAYNLVSGDLSNGFRDVVVRAASGGSVSRVSVTGNIITGITVANSHSFNPSLSADGTLVAFESDATNLAGGDPAFRDIFLRDRGGGFNFGGTSLISRGFSGTGANGNSTQPVITPDGRYVAFATFANNILNFDANGRQDVIVYDRVADTFEQISLSWGGAVGDEGANQNSHSPAISDDGRYVAFVSAGTNIVEGDTGGFTQVYVHDRVTGSTWRASSNPITGAPANGNCANPSMSGDGMVVAFDSLATNLVSTDANNHKDVFASVSTQHGPANDVCGGAIPVTDGVHAFNTNAAHTDGVAESHCTQSANTTLNYAHDVWFSYTATRTGRAFIKTCGLTSWDTMIAIYGGCPLDPNNCFSCNDDACGLQSSLSFDIHVGFTYRIRIGGYDANDFGPGAFLITSCPADVASLGGTLGPDGILTVDDIVLFLSHFFANDTAVCDLAQLGGTPGADGQITVDDLVLFLSLFFSGCQ